MLIACKTSRTENRLQLANASRRPGLLARIRLAGARMQLTTVTWSAYWQPCLSLLDGHPRLVRRLRRLKDSWLLILQRPASRARQREYCWRYFLLLREALRLARAEPRSPGAISLLRRIVGFESFPIEARGLGGPAAGAISARNPVFILGRLGANPPLPTPRHVPLVVPLGQSFAFYSYSLSDYFAAIATVLAGEADATSANHCYFPVRRFNPASLITERGRSVLRQLLKVAAAVIIEDPDLRRNDLVPHARHFGLADAAIIHCAGDRVRTEVEHFAVVRRLLADRLPGTRIW
jgi:hypothetical protein